MYVCMYALARGSVYCTCRAHAPNASLRQVLRHFSDLESINGSHFNPCNPQATGRILGLSDTILGLTVLAFANSVGDLVANLAMARAGMPGMAAAACIGAPLLNLLLGLGSATFLGNILVSMHTSQSKPDRNYLDAWPSFSLLENTVHVATTHPK
jgi:Ca2+/Na+ antiporter